MSDQLSPQFNVYDPERYSLNSGGTSVIGVMVDIPGTGLTSVGLVWNKDQIGVVASAGISARLASTVEQLRTNENLDWSDVASVAFEFVEILKTGQEIDQHG